MGKILGLDIGIASVGWSLIDTDNNKIVGMGVRLFNSADASNNQERRESRSARRILRRKKHRLQNVQELLLENGFNSPETINLNPFKEKYLHADETPVQVLNEEGKKNTTKSYMWVYSTSVNSEHGIRIFQYGSGRAGENAKNFLKGFSGYLHTDAYSGYGKVEDIKRCLCWAHVRRYFTDACPKDMKSPEATLPATGIAYCNQLFEWERKFKDLSPEERKLKRLEKEKPILEAFWSWAESSIKDVLPKSKIGTALKYAIHLLFYAYN